MIHKRNFQIYFLVISLLVGIGLWLAWSPTAQAQCGDIPADSSCKTCHDQVDPVYGTGEWHDIHAGKDCCWNCHGGNTQAQEKDLAHEGMISNPLQDIYTDCHACHPEDYASRADRFGVALGVLPAGSEPTPGPISTPGANREDLKLVILPTPEPAAIWALPWYPEIGLIGLACLGLLVFILLIEKHRAGI